MAKSSLQSFCKKQDKFSKNVTLTYKQENKFATSCGGVAAIIVTLIFTAWFALEFLHVFQPGGAFSTNTTTLETKNEDGQFPVYSIDQEKLFVSYSLITENEEILENGIDKYVTGLWI